MLFIHTNELKIMDIANAETNTTEYHQDNGATPLLGTQTYSPHSPLTYTSVAPAEPPPRPLIESRDADALACVGYLLNV